MRAVVPRGHPPTSLPSFGEFPLRTRRFESCTADSISISISSSIKQPGLFWFPRVWQMRAGTFRFRWGTGW
jgi:hypothetical protein